MLQLRRLLRVTKQAQGSRYQERRRLSICLGNIAVLPANAFKGALFLNGEEGVAELRKQRRPEEGVPAEEGAAICHPKGDELSPEEGAAVFFLSPEEGVPAEG